MGHRKKLLLSFVTTMLLTALLTMPAAAAAKNAVATIGSKSYSSLEEAVRQVKKNQTIVLKKNADYDDNLTINTGSAFTLNLNNKTLTFRENSSLVVKKGNVTISRAKITQKDPNGTIITVNKGASLNIKSGTYKGRVSNAGTLTVAGGTFTNINPETDRTDYLITNTGKMTISAGTFDGKKMNLLENRKTITISGGTFKNSLEVLSYDEVEFPEWTSGWLLDNAKNAKMTISGGKFTAGTMLIHNSEKANLNIKNGRFSSTGNCVLGNLGTAVIENGTCSIKDTWGLAYNNENGKLTVNGGTFNSEWSLFENNSSRSITVNGGKFTSTSDSSGPTMLIAFFGNINVTGGTFKAKDLGLYWRNKDAGCKISVGKKVKVDTPFLEKEELFDE